jgi:glucose dehydrogenase
MVYYGTGNIYPETGRAPGKGLWADTLMANSLRDGTLKWFFQTTHHDEWDYDESNPPIRSNVLINGSLVPVVSVGAKNGYLYVLNARNGGRVPNFGIPEVAIADPTGGKAAALDNTWLTQPEPVGGAGQMIPHCVTAALASQVFLPGWQTAPNGTPMTPACPFEPPYNDQYLVWSPDAIGGLNWPRGTYDPQTNIRYASALITVAGHETLSATDWHQQSITAGGGSAGTGPGGTLSALDMGTNKLAWQETKYNPTPGSYTTDSTPYTGAFTTAGGLLFQIWNPLGYWESTTSPTAGEFDAYDAKTGKKLWTWVNNQGGHPIDGPPITFSVKGKQYVATVVAGSTTFKPASATDVLTVFST